MPSEDDDDDHDDDDDRRTAITDSTYLTGITAGASDIFAREKRKKKREARDAERRKRRGDKGKGGGSLKSIQEDLQAVREQVEGLESHLSSRQQVLEQLRREIEDEKSRR